MRCRFSRSRKSLLRRIFHAVFLLVFLFSSVTPGFTQNVFMPAPGTMLAQSVGYVPAMIRGLVIHPENPLLIDFIVDSGRDKIKGEALKKETLRLIRYFMASLTVPEKEMWVNLSPYEKNRIIPEAFGKTEMGRDLLVQDYILKQLTASLMYPERELGKNFWQKVYSQAKAKFGTDELPYNTFNKVWIVPQDAAVYQNGTKVLIVKTHLKVMLEQDYLAMSKAKNEGNNSLSSAAQGGLPAGRHGEGAGVSAAVKEVLIPAIEKEVNEGKNFANLRQIYNSMILAAWYKINLRESILGKVYADQNKVVGVDHNNPKAKEEIYQQYVQAFKKGAFDYIKEEENPTTEETTSRHYFSGGVTMADLEDRVTGQMSGPRSSPIRLAEAARVISSPAGEQSVAQVALAEVPDSSSPSATAAAVTADNRRGFVIQSVREVYQGKMEYTLNYPDGEPAGHFSLVKHNYQGIQGTQAVFDGRWSVIPRVKFIHAEGELPALTDAVKILFSPQDYSDAQKSEALDTVITHIQTPVATSSQAGASLTSDEDELGSPASSSAVSASGEVGKGFFGRSRDRVVPIVLRITHGRYQRFLQKLRILPQSQIPTADDLIARDPRRLRIGRSLRFDANGYQTWDLPHGISLMKMLEAIKEYDIRGLDGGDDVKFPQQIDERGWRWFGRGLASIPFTSAAHDGQTVGLDPGDFFLIAGDNGPSTGGLPEQVIDEAGNLVPNKDIFDATGKRLPNVKAAVAEGLMDTGVHVIDLGIVGAGALYGTIDGLLADLKKDPEAFRQKLADAGIILSDEMFANLKKAKGGLYITRSHVEVGTNGIKPNIDGITLYAEMLQALKPFILRGVYRDIEQLGGQRGKLIQDPVVREAALNIYEAGLKQQFKELRASLDALDQLGREQAQREGKKYQPRMIVVNFSGGSLAETRRASGEQFYVKLMQDILGPHLKPILRRESDPWNRNGGLADPTREDALGDKKMNVIKISKENPQDLILNFDLDADRISILEDGQLFLGDEEFYPVIEYLLTLDKYQQIYREEVPIYFDSRMKSELAALVRKVGGIAKIHPKGHSKVKATIDREFKKLINRWAAKTGQPATKEAFLAAHPDFQIVQAEYSLHMFMTDNRGNAFDDAVRFGFFWLHAFTQLQLARQKTMTLAGYVQGWKEGPNGIAPSHQVKEQRTSVAFTAQGEDGQTKLVPVGNDIKMGLIYRMTDKVRDHFKDRGAEFEYVEDWHDYTGNNKRFTLVNVEGVYHLFVIDPATKKLLGEVFWGWSNTSNKVAFGTQSFSPEINKQIAEATVALLVHSRDEIGKEFKKNLIPIEDKETGALRDVFGLPNAVAIEQQATTKLPDAAAAIHQLETLNEKSKAAHSTSSPADNMISDRVIDRGERQWVIKENGGELGMLKARFFRDSDVTSVSYVSGENTSGPKIIPGDHSNDDWRQLLEVAHSASSPADSRTYDLGGGIYLEVHYYPGSNETQVIHSGKGRPGEKGYVPPANRIFSGNLTNFPVSALERLISSSPATAASEVGGINFDSSLVNWQIKRDPNGVPMPLNQQPIPMMKIKGFLPVFLKWISVPSLPAFLGLSGLQPIPVGQRISAASPVPLSPGRESHIIELAKAKPTEE
ncbi:MAG: hypothetical protein HQL23_04725 [Candidatus Omnitrophica bacterium]|nr:hypothetical protein [Candidatus Omnitrophota bacterium]